MRIPRLVLLLPALALAASAAKLPSGKPEDVGMSSERLRRVHAVLQRYIESGEVAGTVSLVARKGRVVHLEAQGYADAATRQPMRTDHIFRLASMTKPVTSVAAMMLHEESRFLLHDPVSKFLPEFKSPKVAVANRPHERLAEGYALVPANQEITIQHLLAHTAGLVSGSSGATAELSRNLAAQRGPNDVLGDHIARLAKLPLNFHPGSAWEYGPATDVVGRLVEVVSGMTLDQFFRSRILGPLEMNDTHFYLPDGHLPRLAVAYRKHEGKLDKLTEAGPAARNGKYYSGGGGLAGTAEDYYRFTQMLLSGGQVNGTRLLSRKTVELMTANHIGKHPMWRDSLRGYRFGLGFRVMADPGEAAKLVSVGSYGWGGAYGTYFWVDPKEDMIGILMLQLMPYAHLNIRYDFQNAVTQAITD
ncbi:MAG: beta-lactamase family protein [Acidobacteria bacterium]|nr:beta-lactamase family protein [Acidobacteriota bacterium]